MTYYEAPGRGGNRQMPENAQSAHGFWQATISSNGSFRIGEQPGGNFNKGVRDLANSGKWNVLA